MPNVAMTTKLPVNAKQVWDLIGGFNALPNWHPAVEKSEIVEDKKTNTTTRTLHLVGGGTVVEELKQSDEEGRAYTYSILEGPLPISDYTATLRVKESEGGCEVEWSSDFEAAGAPEGDAMEAIQDIYKAGFENLRKIFGG